MTDSPNLDDNLEPAALKAEIAALQRERSLLYTLIDHLPDLLYVKDAEGRFILVNRAVKEYLQAEEKSDVIGKTDYDFYPEETARAFTKTEKAIMTSGEAVIDLEEKITYEDGSTGWALTNKIPVENIAGEINGLAAMVRIITKQKQAEEATRRQQELIAAQRRALEELSAPIIPVMDRVIILPLIGAVDSVRARLIMRSLLAGISQHRAKVVILDVTGVPIVDTAVADYLNRTIQAARLKGAQAIITGISDAVAETIVELGVDWTHIDTMRDLQSGLMRALEIVGLQIERR